MTARVRFENPPVVEVVCGVAFATIQKFCTPYVGRLWQSLGPEFNKAEDVALLAAPSPAQLDLSEPMPWPRVWLISVLRRLKWISGGLKLALARNGGNLQFLWCLRDEKSAWQSVATVIEPCFRQEFHGGHRAHEQARIKTQAASGSG